mgnify:FL=1
MGSRYDIKIESDFINANNDIEVYESDDDHIQDTIEANIGSYKQFPTDGVVVNNFLNIVGQSQIIRIKIQLQLKSDKYNITPVVGFDADGHLILEIP